MVHQLKGVERVFFSDMAELDDAWRSAVQFWQHLVVVVLEFFIVTYYSLLLTKVFKLVVRFPDQLLSAKESVYQESTTAHLSWDPRADCSIVLTLRHTVSLHSAES